MALTVVRDTLPNGATTFPGSDGKLYERWKITGDGAGGNADILLAGGRTPKSVKLLPGNITPAASAYAVTLQPSSSVDVRIAVPASLAAGQYFFGEIEVDKF